MEYFGLSQRFDASTMLRNILTDAIAALKPAPDVPAPQRAWRAYESLFSCYVQQLSQQIVADQLAMSARQLRREQQAALELLSDKLWEKYQLHLPISLEPARAETDESSSSSDDRFEDNARVNPELAWLKNAPPDQPADLHTDLTDVMSLAQPLATQFQVQLDLQMPQSPALPALAVHTVALHQILLNLLSVAIQREPQGRICIKVSLALWEAIIQVSVEPVSMGVNTAGHAASDAASLHMAQELASISGSHLVITDRSDQPFSATLAVPLLQQRPVLVVDDNADALHLLQRYADGSRYRVMGTQDPEQVLSMVEAISPQVIVLDVMMPHVDGWKLLGRLRQHPLTEQTAIIVCTILPQEKLALSLGASAFLRKPITRQAFLAALDQQIAPQAPTPD
jgi:CheY-like chemotaxis protein